ncbi:MAG: cache domain-containing protein [Clostridia bacterium]|nr:cache domain-containing protein [Clostridia bacterium]
MFKNLYRSIYLPIVLIAVALILIIDILSITILTETLKDAYNGMDEKRVARALDSCKLYISSVASSAYNLSLDDDLIRELAASAPTGNPIVSKLDNTCNYSLKINAVCAYSVNGAVYTSSQIANVPTIEELKKVDEIKEFINGDEAAAISLRCECIADIYNNASYPDEMGVITCCRKVYDGDKVIGWIFADILPSNLYSIIFSNGKFENAVAFISSDKVRFEYANNSRHENLLNGKHKGYFKYGASDEGFSITVFNSTKDYDSKLIVLIVILLAVSAGLAVAVHFAARLTAASVTNRLDRLIQKMNSQKIA